MYCHRCGRYMDTEETQEDIIITRVHKCMCGYEHTDYARELRFTDPHKIDGEDGALGNIEELLQ